MVISGVVARFAPRLPAGEAALRPLQRLMRTSAIDEAGCASLLKAPQPRRKRQGTSTSLGDGPVGGHWTPVDPGLSGHTRDRREGSRIQIGASRDTIG